MADRVALVRGEVRVDVGDVVLDGALSIPEGAQGVVAFAHGSGSSRLSSRNRFVAEQLNDGGLATLLFDLLTGPEHLADQQTALLRFDIELLSRRLVGAIDWLTIQEETAGMSIGLFGASTGAAAALIAAAERPEAVGACVSRGGRPDLAGEYLPRVQAPTLLLVGSNDPVVLELNRKAARAMRGEHQLEIIPRATHLFQEPGTLEQVASLARQWFQRYLVL